MSSRIQRAAAVIAVAVLGVAVIAGCGSSSSSGGRSSSSSPSVLRIAYDPNPTNTSIIVAQQQGFFTKNHLDVKLISSAATAALLPSVGKQYDLVGAGPSNILQGAAAGYKLQLVASETVENGTTKRNTYLIGAKGITSIKQLKGKAIGSAVDTGTQFEALLYALKQVGISKNQVRVIQVPFASMGDELQSGTIQAALAINPFASQMLGEKYTDLGDPIAEAVNGQTTLSIGWIASQSWTRSHTKVLNEFDKAQNEALAWMKTHQSAAKKILITDFKLPAVAADHYPVLAYVSFPVKASYLSAWVKPLQSVGALSSSFDIPISQLIRK